MKKGICLLSMIPMRREPSERSEMVSQLLFGEGYSVLEETTGWCKIKTSFDQYTGWVDVKTVAPVSETYFRSLETISYPVVQTLTCRLVPEDQSVLTITAGSTLGTILPDQTMEIDSRVFRCLDTGSIQVKEMALNDRIIRTARLFINAPYLWGGRSPFGMDCSGFVQVVFKMNGLRLPRDARQQAALGTAIRPGEAPVPGDLVFFADDEGTITHVGIKLEDNLIIHCSGQVRTDRLDTKGIFHEQLRQYTHRLHSVRRIQLPE